MISIIGAGLKGLSCGLTLQNYGYSVKIMGLNVNSNPNEPGYLTHVDQGVYAAAQMGADVINCSWNHGYSSATEVLYNSIYNQYGCITLGAAGNGQNFGGIEGRARSCAQKDGEP